MTSCVQIDPRILIKNSQYTGDLKRLLLNADFLENKCAICESLPIWYGEPLDFLLDYLNNDKTDCRLENVRILCPNCHQKKHATKNFK